MKTTIIGINSNMRYMITNGIIFESPWINAPYDTKKDAEEALKLMYGEDGEGEYSGPFSGDFGKTAEEFLSCDLTDEEKYG